MRVRVETHRREDLIEITAEVRQAVRSAGIAEGAALIFCPHTTAAITINENADPDVQSDLVAGLGRMAPRDAGYRHREGNSDGHLKSSTVGASELVPIEGGELVLGTWQGIYFCEFDGPRSRWVSVTVLPGA